MNQTIVMPIGIIEESAPNGATFRLTPQGQNAGLRTDTQVTVWRYHPEQLAMAKYAGRITQISGETATFSILRVEVDDRWPLEPVYNLFRISTAKARTTICWLVLSFLSQFFQRRRHFSSQPKDRSTTHRFGSTTKVCSSLRFTTSTEAPSRLCTAVAKGFPVYPHPPAHSAPGSGWPGAGPT